MKLSFQWFAILILILQACSPRVAPETVVTKSTPGIIFLAYELKKDSSNNKYTASLIQQLYGDGQVEPPVSKGIVEKGDIEISFRDSEGEETESYVIADPLRKTYEAVNAEGQLVKKEFYENRAEVLLRTNYKISMNSVNIGVYITDKQQEILNSHKLNATK